MVIAGAAGTGCAVVQVVQTGSGSPPGGLVAVTALVTLPVAVAATVAV
jgi:hypothetical protein